jgi:hypothetical protein
VKKTFVGDGILISESIIMINYNFCEEIHRKLSFPWWGPGETSFNRGVLGFLRS